MNKYRMTIEELKAECRTKFTKDAEMIKAALLREIDYYYRRSDKGMSLHNFADIIFNNLKIPRSFKNKLNGDLMAIQRQIAEVWQDYFASEIGQRDLDYEKLLALYKVDFRKIEESIKKIVVAEIRKAETLKQGFSFLRNNLLDKGLGVKDSYTLANTALSQYDNNIHVEFALQAGIKNFKYDGLISPGTREFCRLRVGQIFTLDELKSMDNKQGLPVETSLGGYNCQHYLTAIVD